jgi:hypothetical protein
MLSSKQVLDLITSKSGGKAGAAMAMKRQLEQGRRAPGFQPGAADQRRFLEAFIGSWQADRPGAIRTAREPKKSYAHPERAARHPRDASGRGGPDLKTGLEPADIVWLQRLPTDPTKVTYADAVQLASLYNATKPNTSDRRLVESIWRPVKQVHDLKAAEAELELARQPLPDVPSSALGALTEAVRAETSELTDEEVVARASQMLRTALDGRTAQRDAAIGAAQAQIAALRDAQAQREALTA